MVIGCLAALAVVSELVTLVVGHLGVVVPLAVVVHGQLAAAAVPLVVSLAMVVLAGVSGVPLDSCP